MKKHSSNDATKTAQTTAGIAPIMTPIIPFTINKGKKAATVVSIADITGGPIRFAASTDAS